MKVIEVSQDSITVMYNTQTVKKTYKSALLDKSENYDSTLINRFSLQKLKEFHKTKYIKAIKRP
ncbi:hypothetical protein [uncultured Psychroserpens sp.]|uniref:hypothetical protein n=1 Tax=uncultured Psychroserpens sp. TaxID=255436 RepID=UPI002621F94B|nr:hypothetical protein [uncultured Psychroserpens sp.]